MTSMPRVHFHIEEYVELILALRREGARFETLSESRILDAEARHSHFVKHDIHHDLENTFLMAQAEEKIGVKANYFFMPRNKINAKYFDNPDTWRKLRSIRDMGHVVGMHIDAFSLVEQAGDLYKGVAEAKAGFLAEGIDARVGNTHGNSSYRARLKLESVDFYKEFAGPNLCEDPFWRGQHSRYSLSQMGFEAWADTTFWTAATGRFLCRYFVTDNSKSLTSYDLPDHAWQIKTPQFEIPEEFALALVKVVPSASCVYLIHPQFFRPKERPPDPR
ncbi:MAG: hypothetical protein ACHQAQ_17595 [Hyphomicrobiales bacterium]